MCVVVVVVVVVAVITWCLLGCVAVAMLDMNISQFLKTLGLEHLRDIFEREQVSPAHPGPRQSPIHSLSSLGKNDDAVRF